MKLFARITKVDEAKREVWGRAVQEVPDNADEIFDYATSKPHFEKWSSDFEKITNGKSLGNIRAMHGAIAAGKATQVIFVDDEKAIDVCSKIVDDNEWKKVLEGVYTGYSIGGRYVNKWKDGDLTRYTAKPSEISLVDKPCIPTATFFDIVKEDGTTVQKKFQTPEEAVEELAELLNKGEITPQQLVQLAKARKMEDEGDEEEGDEDMAPEGISQEEWDKMDEEERAEWLEEHGKADAAAATKKEKGAAPAPAAAPADAGEVKKGMFNVQNFAACLESCSYIFRAAQADASMEGDNSPVPAQLRSWIAAGVEIFKTMAAEEADELVAGLKGKGAEALVQMAERAELVKKMDSMTPEEFSEAITKALTPEEIGDAARTGKSLVAALKDAVVAKYGKMDSEEVTQHLQGAHDALVKCGMVKCNTGKADGLETAKAAEPPKTNDEVARLGKLVDDLLGRLKKVEDVPAPVKGKLRVIGKGDDASGESDGKEPEIVSTPGQHNPEAAHALIKAAFEARSGLRKI